MGAARPSLRSVEARNRLIEDNVGLAHAYAARLAAVRPDAVEALGSVDDAVQVALMGLIRAAELFDPTLGFSFSTYAWCRMRQALGRELQRSGFIRIPCHRGDRRELLAALRVVSFGDLPDDHGRSYDPPDAEPNPDAAAKAAELARLHWALARLPPRTRLIVEGYWLEGRTLTSIAAELAICKERARQLRARGEAKLRRLLGSPLVGPLPRREGRRPQPAVAVEAAAAVG